MENEKKNDPELAAALFFLLGEPVPHDPKLEKAAGEIQKNTDDRQKLLLRVIELCGEPTAPQTLYLCEKAYSWLGKTYSRETIRLAKAYLEGEEWDALSSKIEMVDGIEIDHRDEHRAGVLIDLARAQEGVGALEEAYSNYLQAYDLEPYNAMVVVKAAEVLSRLRGREEALNFLLQQRSSLYYEPVKYRDSLGRVRRNEVFRELVEAHILKLQGKS